MQAPSSWSFSIICRSMADQQRNERNFKQQNLMKNSMWLFHVLSNMLSLVAPPVFSHGCITLPFLHFLDSLVC